MDKAQCRIGIGIIVRHHDGSIIATMRMRKSLFPNPFLVKVCGALEVTKFGINLGLHLILLEGDSLKVIQTINKVEDSWSCAEMFISDFKQ